ncbi:MAG: transcriptional repressor [Clostridia bacterium]
MKKYSRQREALLTEIRGRKDHPTAEDLYLSLRAIMPNYSLGTVYRNLSELCANGYVMKIASVSGPERYDGCVTPHGHFTCTKCGKVYDLGGVYEKHIDKDAIIKELKGRGENDEIMTVEEIRMMLYGTCRHCGAEE